MAYDFGRQYVQMTTTGGSARIDCSATTAVKRGVFHVGNDMVIQAVGVINLTASGDAVDFSWRVTATAGAASASGTEFAQTALGTGQLRGKATVRKGLNTTVSAGSEVVVQCIATATGKKVGAFMYVQNRPFDWANNTKVTLVTT